MRRVPGVIIILLLDYQKRSVTYCKAWIFSFRTSWLRLLSLQFRPWCFLFPQSSLSCASSSHKLQGAKGLNFLELILLGRYEFFECRLRTCLINNGLSLVNLFMGRSCHQSYRRSRSRSPKHLVWILTRTLNLNGDR